MALEGEDIAQVFVYNGCEHTLAVTRDGKLYSFGYNYRGQLGNDKRDNTSHHTSYHAILSYILWTRGINTILTHFIAMVCLPLGHGSTTIETVPRLVKGLLSRKVVLAACSYHHSIILCSDGTLHSCGRNDVGQLGHGDTIDKKTPHQVMLPFSSAQEGDMTGISCGQFHSVIVTSSGSDKPTYLIENTTLHPLLKCTPRMTTNTYNLRMIP